MRDPLRRILDALKRLMVRNQPEAPPDPDDPYSLVGAPLKPRTPLRSSSVAVDPDA